MQKYLPIYLVLLLLAFSSHYCKGQEQTEQAKPTNDLQDFDPYFTESKAITTSAGPKSITRNILQDSNGDFWFATWEGIFHYDGKVFTNFTNKEGLRRYRVFTILEDKNGGLWFGTIGAGLYHYDGQVFTNITTKDGLVNDKIISLYEDKTGGIWIGTVGGLSFYDGKPTTSGQLIFRNFTTKEGLIDNEINAIVEDKNGKFWFGTRGKAFTYDGEKFTLFTNEEDRPFVNVRSIIEDQNCNIWLGGNNGLWRYNGEQFTNFNEHFTGYIYEDKKGNIWTSSEGEHPGTWVLSRYDENLLSYKHPTNTPLKKTESMFFEIKKDDDGNSTWVLPDPDKKPLTYEQSIAIPIKQIDGMFFGIIEDSEGHIWFGSLEGVGRYDGKFFNYFRAKGNTN